VIHERRPDVRGGTRHPRAIDRPLARRAADRDPIAIHTAGAHVVTVLDAPEGLVTLGRRASKSVGQER
jgi:hypothetical protein